MRTAGWWSRACPAASTLPTRPACRRRPRGWWTGPPRRRRTRSRRYSPPWTKTTSTKLKHTVSSSLSFFFQPTYFLLDVSGVSALDLSACMAISSICKELRADHGVKMGLVGVTGGSRSTRGRKTLLRKTLLTVICRCFVLQFRGCQVHKVEKRSKGV